MSVILREEFTQDLSSAAAAESFGFDYYGDVEVLQVTIHASTNITETITITLNSKTGANYDTVLDTTSLSTNDEYAYVPSGRPVLQVGDKLDIDVTNANTTGTVYGTVLVRKV